MSKVSRSSRKWKDEDNGSKRRKIVGKERDATGVKGSTTSGSMTESSGLRRSARNSDKGEKHAMPTPTKKRSERMEKSAAPSTPVSTRKSERVDKQVLHSPTSSKKKSDKGVKQGMPSSSNKGTKQGISSSTDTMKKKPVKGEKQAALDPRDNKKGEGDKQAAVDTREKKKGEKHEKKDVTPTSNGSGLNSAQRPKRLLDARSYRAAFSAKPKAKVVKEPDLGENTKMQEKFSGGDSDGESDDGCERRLINEIVDRDCIGEASLSVGESMGKGDSDTRSANSKGTEEGGDEHGERRGYKKMKPKGKHLEGSASGLTKHAKGVKRKKQKTESIRFKKKRKLQHKDAHVSNYNHPSPESNPEDTDSQRGSQNAELQSTYDGIKTNIEEVQLCRSGRKARAGSMGGAEGAQMEEDSRIEAGSITKTAVKMDYQAKENHQALEITESNSSEGRSTSKRKSKSMDPDVDISVTAGKDISNLDTSTADTTASSPSGGKSNKSSERLDIHNKDSNYRCASCFKQQRVDDDSENLEICSCNAKTCDDLCDISFSEGVCEHAALLKSAQRDKIIVRCFWDGKTKEKLDLDATTRSAEPQRQNVLAVGDSHTTKNVETPLIQDRVRPEVNANIGITEECGSTTKLKKTMMANLTNREHNTCAVCKLGGKLLCCDGKGCTRTWHLSCLDPPLNDVPPGIWHCLWCVKKKLESGVQSVSEGVESIWDFREVEISEGEGKATQVTLKEKQYFVKFQGLAHVHNCWVSESRVLVEAPTLVAKFNRRYQKEKVIKWKSEWTIPQRLLQRRLLMSPKQADEYFVGDTNIQRCKYEWFVKWKGLGYEHCTWELENLNFLKSSEGILLMKDYESRRAKAKKASDPSGEAKERRGSFSNLRRLPDGIQPGLDGDHLKSVNKLRESWHKCQNAVVIDDKERTTRVILFILSLQRQISRPFLIISTSAAISVWESEFMHLAPSVNVVVYGGNRDVRETIRSVEFFEDGGSVMFEVLLSSPDAVVEDVDALECLGWEAVIVDECLRSKVSKYIQQIRTLSTDFRLLLLSDQIKDNIAEYLNLLSFLDSESDGNCTGVLKHDVGENVALTKLKERLGQYIVYEHKSDSSKFKEYWVPVHLSKVQVEQYCTILSSNYSSLRSNLKNDRVGALREVLISTRKCCDHPYLVNDSLQSLLTKGLPEVEFLNVGVNACGKLQLLDKILPEIRKRGLRVLIIFQLIGGSKPYYIGDILDDYLRQRFGADSYERIDCGLITSKKQAALNMFNNKERGRFVFLIENRACLASIKLSSVDTVILFDSDWNPLNDIRALQKINIDYQYEQLKIFRLYSPYTVEEKILVLAKQDPIVESNLLNMSSNMSHALLIWGSTHLFSKLDEIRDHNGSSVSTKLSSEQPTLNDVAQELLDKLFHRSEVSNANNSTTVLRVQQRGTNYCKTVSLVGESEMQLTDEVPPHVYWMKLLEGRFPGYAYSAGLFQRPRRKVQYFEGPSKAENDREEAKKKHKKIFSAVDPISLTPWLQDKKKVFVKDKEAKVASSDGPPCRSDGSSFVSPKESYTDLGKTTKDAGAAFGAHVDDRYACLPWSPTATNHPNHDSKMPALENHILESSGVHLAESGESRKGLRDAQQNLHLMLKPELLKLCTTLRVPEEVKAMSINFLGYIMSNHQVPREPETILQAFQISLCWTAASFLKQKMDHKLSLALAKQHLNFECKEEEAESVYSKLRLLRPFLKSEFWCRMGASNSSGKSGSQEGFAASQSAPVLRSEPPTAPDLQEIEEGEIVDDSRDHHSVERPPVSLEQDPQSQLLKKERTQKKNSPSSNRIKITMEQQREIKEFNKLRETEKAKLKKSHKLERELISTMYNDLLVREQKLKELDEIFAKKRNDLDQLMNGYQKKLAAMQLDAWNKEKQGHACLSGAGQKSTKSFTELRLLESGIRPECSGNRENNAADNSENRVSRASFEHNADANVPEVSPGVSETAHNQMEESIPMGTVPERTAEGSIPVRAITESSAEQNMPVGGVTEIPAEQNMSMGAVTESPEEDNMPGRTAMENAMENGTLERAIVTEAEQHSTAGRSTGAGSVSQHQSQTDFCHHASLPSPQVPSMEDIQPAVSLATGEQTLDSEGQGSLQQTQVPIQLPVDPIPSQAEHFNHYTPLPQPQTQFQLPSYTDMHLEPNPVVDSRNGSSQLESGNRPSQTFVSTSQMAPLVHLDPLQNELVRLRREEDQAIKMHEEEKMRLNTECEREIEEVRRKYNVLLQDAEMGLGQRRMAFEMNFNKVLMNRILAEAIKLQLHDPKAPLAGQPGMPATFTQFVNQAMLPPAQRPVHSSIPASPPAPAAPAQGAPHTSTARFSGNPVAPHFGPPLPRHGNLQAGEPRAMGPLGPHTNPGWPAAPLSAPSLQPNGLPGPSSLHPMPPLPSASHPSYLVALSGSRPLPQLPLPPGSGMLPAFTNPPSSLSALGLLMDLDNRRDMLLGAHGAPPFVPGLMPDLPALQESEATFDARVLPELQLDSGPLIGASVRTAASADVVCLSDDD